MADICFVVPVYKVKEKYVEACVASLCNQRSWDVQIILVDDCSPDGCGRLCDRLAEQDARIQVIHKPVNEGVSAARSSGLDACSAKWVSFVDADDWLDTDLCDRLSNYLSAAEQEPDILIFSGYRSYPSHEQPDVIHPSVQTWSKAQGNMEELQLIGLCGPLKGYPVRALAIESVCAKLYSVDFLKKSGVRFSRIPHREDGLFFQEILDEAESVMQVPEYGYHYRMTAGSAVNSYRPNSPAEQNAFLKLLFQHAERRPRSAQYKTGLYAAAFLSMQICITQHFFHEGNTRGFWKRHRECRAYFSEEPYRSFFANVKLSALKRNHLIKALCIRMHWYAGVSLLRKIYFMKKDFDFYE